MPHTCVIVLVSYGHKYGPLPGASEHFNLRKLPQPKASVRLGRTGLQKSLQSELFAIPEVMDFYESLQQRLLAFISTAAEQFHTTDTVSETDRADTDAIDTSDATDTTVDAIDTTDNIDTTYATDTRELGDSADRADATDDDSDTVSGNVSDDTEEDSSDSSPNDSSPEIVIGIGCHAGKHRSVAFVDRLVRDLSAHVPTHVVLVARHRDVEQTSAKRRERTVKRDRGKRSDTRLIDP
eukprot:TRINITY_DN6958_c0_g1_i1.p2 TRINITY_DN6958_c0_g1~~TRINITY_DN6958_c0_g1_i1.p2  ORF type:complete len:238 (-),score=42.53 TRINITY_DN6958_c0_g1_i1:234-947(-)